MSTLPTPFKRTKLKPSLIPLGNKSKDTTTEKLKKTTTVIEEYIDCSSLNKTFITNYGLIEMGRRLIEWANKKDTLILTEFCLDEGIDTEQLHRWADMCQELKKAKSYALRKLAIKREKGALTRTLERGMVTLVQHRYDKEWHTEVNEYHVRLKAMQQSIQNQIEGKGTEDKYIYIKDIPEDEIEKKDETGT